MALDVNKFNDLVNQKVAEKQQPPEEEKSIFEQIGEVVTNQSDINRQVAQESTEIAQDALQTAGQGIDLVVNTASDINNAYHNFLDEQRNITGAYTTANINQANETGDYSFQNKAVENLQQAGQELIYSPLKQVSRAIVNRYSDDNESILQDVAQGIQESNAYVNYMMTDEEKLQKAIEIENETGIKAKEFLSDTTAYREAIEIYNYAKKKKELGGDMNDVFNEFPELKNIASMDAQSAALALHDINSVRETQGVIDSFNKMWEYGNKHLEYSNLNYKLMTGQATEEDKARIEELKKQLEQAPNLPAFLDNPFAVIAGGVAGSMPMMIQSMGEMIDDFAIGASAGMVAGALAGSAVPVIGNVGGSLAGAVGGGVANTIRANAIRQGAMQGARLTGGYLARYGMFAGMAKPATGGYYAEFKDLKGEDGKPLLSDEAAQDYAVVAGALNAGIEMLDFGLIKDAFTGNVAKQTVKEIIATAQKQALAKEGIKSFFTNRASAIAKVSMAESGEEGLQSVSDDLVHNQIMQDTGDTTNRVYTATEIAQRALMSAGEALPGAIGFGVISAGVGGFNESLGFSRNLKRLMSNNAKLEQSTRQTFAGTLMLERLQSAVRNSKLKKTAPKVQERLLRSQLDNTGFEMAYVDIPTALESQTGKQDLETLAKTAGYTQEDLKTAIEIGGTLAIPTAKFAQAETTSDIMRAVTFNQEADPIGKLRKNAETITNEMQDSIQKTADKQRMLIDAIMQEQFANGTKEQQTMAQAVIYNNVSNPAKGWKQVHDDQINERNNILVPAIDAIKKSIEQNDTWYQKFYAKHNRAMTDKEIEDMAYKLTVGDETAPSTPTWQATTPEAVQALAENKNILDDIDNNLKVLDEIKSQLSNLNGVEMRLAEGLTKDGYAVYNRLSKQLQNVGGKVKRASRMSAILFARHADIVADIMRRHGNENYTAMTYYNERFALNIKDEVNKNKGDITLLSNGQRVINLYKAADESTFVHEMAHMFLMDLDELAKIDELSKKELDIVNDWASWKNEKSIDEYKNAPWYKEFKARHESIINAQNAGDVAKVEELKEAWRQERFARAFELYLQKGTAPSKGLKDVFRKFKKFLRDIYIGFTSIGGVASPKVEAIMQRMVATEEEINQMALDDRYRDITKAGGEKLLDETEEQTYKRWHKEATEEAKEHLMKIVMQDLKAEAKAKFDERVEKERAYKLNELENQPVYIAQEAYKEAGDINIVLNWFGSVEEYKQALKNTKPIQTALDEYMKQYEKTLDTELMESHLSEENILQAMEDSKYTSKLVAMETRIFNEKVKLINKIGSKTQVAMQDVEDKLNALDDYTDLKVDKEDARVKNVMNALNKLRFSTKWNAKDLGRIEAMFNSNTKETLAEAFKQFVEETKQQHEGKLKMFKEMAERALDGKTIFEACNVALYRKNESMHARRVKQAVKASNWERAMKEKEAQYISAAMAQKALKNKLYIQKKIEKVNKQLKVRSIKLPAQERYWHKHLAYILGITNKDANPPVDGITPLADLFKGLQDSLDLEYTPTDILEITSRSDFSGYQSMTIAQFEDAVEALDILYTTGRDKFKLKTIQGKSIDDAINEIILDDTAYNRSMVINKKINPDKGGLGYNDLVDKIPLIGDAMARGGAKYLSSMMKPEEIINILGTKAHKYLYETYERASNLEAEMMTKNVYKIKEILKDYSHSEKLSWKKQQYKLEFEDGTVENLSKENIICMALNFGNDINRSRLAVGFGLTEEYLKEFVEKHMTKKDWQMVQDIWNHLHSFWKDTVRVEQELNGVTLKPQQPTPFDVKLPDGEILHLEGGYYPIVANPLKSNRANEQEVNEAVRRTMSGAQVLGTGRGFTKARSQANIDRALLLEFSVIPDHLSNVIHNITHRIPARDVYRLVKNKQFEEYVNRTMGKEIYQVLDEWAVDNWRVIPEASNNKTVQKVSKMLSYLRTNSTLAIMGYRLYPIIENMTNIAPMMDKLGAMKSLVAIADYYTNISKYQEVLHKSIFMKNRLNHMDRDIKYIPGLFDEDRLVTGFLKEHAYTLMTYSDLMFSAPLWCRSYKDAYAKKLDEIKKENEANVEKLQNAQAKVSTIRARIMDLQQNALKSNFDVQGTNINQVGDFKTFVNTREELNQLQKDLYMAEVELDNASELRFLTDKEILAEAESRSIAEADKSIREVFGSGQTKDLASIQKGGELLKLFTPFYTFFNTQANAILQAYYKGKFMKPTTMGENITRWLPVARSFLYRIVLTAALSTMLRMALLGDGSDDKHKYEKVKNAEGTEEKIEIPAMQRFLTQFGKNTLSTMAGTMWGVRDIASFFINESFEGTDYGRGIGFSNVALAGGEKITALYKLLDKKAEKDLEIADKEAKWQAEYMKAGAKKRKTMLEDKQYQKPPKRITYADIAKASGEIGTTFFAARTGITSTMANSVFTTMQYIADGDGRYDTNLKNIIWSALFNKKPVERVIPEKPKKKGKSKNVRRY
ncbi:hypothetical protein [Veillonella sp.]|uniref:hypothetical protein n=1 Tax=Veillonella sp. TaxID=1926307 RepID=UPI0025DF84B4|nr:hypothetical protein [Veillonella sp.]